MDFFIVGDVVPLVPLVRNILAMFPFHLSELTELHPPQGSQHPNLDRRSRITKNRLWHLTLT
jgi:hypothetical protein